MAYVIIPPQHQAAPKEPARLIQPFEPTPAPAVPSDRPSWESYDDEMSGGPCLRSDDAQANATMRRMYEDSLKQERLDFVEEALRQHEKTANDERIKNCRWQGQQRWQGRENEEMRMVRIMHPHTFIEKLQRAGIKALVHDPFEWFREQNIDPQFWPRPEARLWLNSFVKLGRVGVTAVIKGQPTTVTTLQYPYGPEYSIMRFDQYNVPTNEKYRGWRTALLSLILRGVLTEEEAEKAFGPALGPASEFYREQLFHHRSIRYGLRVQ